MNIRIEKSGESNIDHVNFDKVGFGNVFSDHMFVCEYSGITWKNPRIVPYGQLSIHPSIKALHYGQAVFEGMRAYCDDNGKLWLFRPEENAHRLNRSAVRLGMPEFPTLLFIDAIKRLVALDKKWVMPGEGNSLYIRPFMFASEETLTASPSSEYMMMIICSPVQSYYSGDISVKIADHYSRAASGGTGYAKAAGNYAGQFYPTTLANRQGFQQVIWTDANRHEYLEEAGTMNIFFRIDDTLITAPTSDRILDGVTRKSIIALAKEQLISVEERSLKVSELIKAANSGDLKEIFGCGTAVVISSVNKFGYGDKVWKLNKVPDSYALKLKKQIIDIQYNRCEDAFGWRMAID